MHKYLYVRICWWFGLAVLGLPLLLRLLVLLRGSPAALNDVVDFIFDDGYYYLGIAANFADTGRSTLDGITLTNGYQPLWFLTLYGLAKFVGTEPWTFFVASCALIYTIAIAGPLLALFWRNRPWWPSVFGLGAALSFVIIQQPDVFVEGLEPILFVPLVLPLIVLIERAATMRDWILLSVVLAVAFLVRLDALTLYLSSIPVLAYVTIASERRLSPELVWRVLRIGLALSIAVIPTVIVYFAFNKWYFHSAVPTSGIAKMIGGPLFSNWGVALTLFYRWKSLSVLITIALALEGIARIVVKPEPLYYRSLAVFAMAVAGQCIYYCAFSAWYTWPWYAYLIGIMMVLIVARIIYLASLLLEVRRARLACLVATAALGVWACHSDWNFKASSLREGNQSLSRPRFFDKSADRIVSFNQVSLMMLRDFIPAVGGNLVAMGDRAGGLAYWGRHQLSVVQTEGLTLDIDYLRAIAANEGKQYLQAHYPITYLIVDREHVPEVVGSDGRPQYVVAEPIQGRVTFGPVPIYCFPEDAARYKRAYRGAWGTNVRIAFAFAEQAPCSAAANTLISSVERGMGLRQFSLPSEYDPALIGTTSKKALEDRDRGLARMRLGE